MAPYNETRYVASSVPPTYPVESQPVYLFDTREINSNAISSLIWAILAWTCLPIVGAIIALVVAHLARREIRAARLYMRGEGLAAAAMILAWVHIISILLVLVLFLLFFSAIVSVVSSNRYR